MPGGLFPDTILVERFQASVSAATLAQPFVAPVDLDVVGLVGVVGTAPGASTMTINVSNAPTSQLGGSTQETPNPYNLWTTTNVPSIKNAATSTFTVSQTTTVVANAPYALNYPLPGPSGTTGFTTAQATSQTTETPVTAPPTRTKFNIGSLVAPDNTYTDYNGLANTANIVHAGDVLSFVVGGTVGSAANLEVVLFAQRR